ncbi:HdeD family acid-resistance protein [Arthrobacter woluwensis]|uniref:Uncharacterized membrane protein HdeD, DUF308 family n=1 Tax=Arthrobacter woluwensis TaxID=156980 RepID=A0A1H4KJ58_9MICC|nr:DUF308 domain-containing protein [Arthrobacter woluwensis]SEB58108.1 Uncharacterized membrane protein HdeD, DUF308 family [Arthrobacter woluwensis]
MSSIHQRFWTLPGLLGKHVARLPWWVVFLVGLASLAGGVWLFLHPLGALTRIEIYAGAGFVLSGLGDLADAAQEARGGKARRRLWPFLLGLVWIAAGLVVLLIPLPSAVLVYLAALTFVSSGATRLVEVLRNHSDAPWQDLLRSILDLVLAAFCAVLPGTGTTVLAFAFGLRSALVGLKIAVLSVTKLRRAQAAA